MSKIYIIDASGYIYRNYFAIRNMTNSKGESTNALFGFIRSIHKLIKDFKPDHLVAVFDGPNNAKKRIEIYPEYKAHRATMPPDLRYQIDWARQFCELMGLPYLNIPEVEADDVMGSIAVWASAHGVTSFLCTSDKDMCQLVSDSVFILNTNKENQLITAKEVENIHGVPPSQMIDLLAMTGDSSDNVPGLPGFGPKTAAELLKSFGSLEYILKHPQEIPGKKKQETIELHSEKAILSKSLVTVDTQVTIPKELHFYHIKPPHIRELKDFYTSMNFSSLLKELEQTITPSLKEIDQEHEDYAIIDDETQLTEVLAQLSAKKNIAFKILAEGERPLISEIIGLALASEEKKACYIPINGKLGKEKVISLLKPFFESSSHSFYGHNVKYDYHVLANYGIQLKNINFDTLIASYVLNSSARRQELNDLVLEYFGKVLVPSQELTGKGKKQISFGEVSVDLIKNMCCQSVDFICRLKTCLESELKERKLENLYYELELPLVRVLAAMERHGIFLDFELLKSMSNAINKEIKDLELLIYQMAGIEFNINSPLQLKKVLFESLAIPYPRKKASDQSTGEEILELLKNDYPIASKVLDYRRLEKLRSTYVDSLPHEIHPVTHRIHCNFNQSVAATGRLSCQDPNLQNIPVRTEVGRKIREAFRPEKTGWSYLAADYSQIELRLLAHLSEDPSMMHAFLNNEDIHTLTAANIFGIPMHEVTKEQRYNAKAVNFGIVYGQQAFGLSQGLSISTSEAAAFIETYFKRFAKVKEYLESCKKSAHETGKAVTYTGRERLIPEINSKNGMLRSQAERLAVNTPIQGTAADLIKIAMLKIDERLKKEHKLGYMILQIHDELIFEVPDFEIINFEHIVKEEMEKVFKLKVPLVVDIVVGKNWKEC